jgi:hypothetical protein
MSLYATNIAEAMRHSVMAKAMGFDLFKAAGLELLYNSSDNDKDDDNDSYEIGASSVRTLDA